MPFQGNPNAGQPDPALLGLLFQEKSRREELAMKQQAAVLKAQAAAEKNRRDEEAHQAALLKTRVETANALKKQEEQIGADQKTANAAKSEVAQQYPFVSAPGRQTPMGMEYGALPDQTIENGLIQNQFSDRVQRPIDARQAMLAANMAQVPGFENYGNTLGAQGALAQATTDRKAQEELQKELDKAARDNAESDRRAGRDQLITQQNKLMAERLRDENIITDETAKVVGAMNALGTLQIARKDTMKDIASRRAAGVPTADLEERVNVINGQIAKIKNPNTVINRSPIPFSEKVKLANQFASAGFVTDKINSLADQFLSGEVVGGATGKLIGLRERGRSLFEQVLQQDPNLADTDAGKMIQEAVSSGKSTVKVSDQLTLGLDQLFLAYAYSRMGRGNAKFTVSEMQRVLKELDFTGVFTTPEQIQGALRHVAEQSIQEKRLSFQLLAEDPDFRDSLRNLDTLPEDEALLNRLRGEGGVIPGAVGPVLNAPKAAPTKPADWTNATEQELLDQFGR